MPTVGRLDILTVVCGMFAEKNEEVVVEVPNLQFGFIAKAVRKSDVWLD